MEIFYKIFDLYRNDTVLMLQLNVITIFIAVLIYQYLEDRRNLLSKQVLKRVRKVEKKNKKTFRFSLEEGFLNKLVIRAEAKAKIKLERSNVKLQPREYALFLLGGAAIGAAIGFVVFPFAGIWKALIFFANDSILELTFARLLAAVTFGFVGTYTPIVILNSREKKRKKLLSQQLIDFILSLADGIVTARTTQEALYTLSEEMRDPLASELKRTVKEIDLNMPFDEALENLKNRLDLEEYSLILSSIQIQNRTGGKLEKMLRNMAKVSEERRELISETKKTVNDTKGMANILLAAPFVMFGAFVFLQGEDFLDQLLSPFGLIYFGVLAVIIAAAMFWLRVISKGVDKLL